MIFESLAKIEHVRTGEFSLFFQQNHYRGKMKKLEVRCQGGILKLPEKQRSFPLNFLQVSSKWTS